MVGRSPLPRWSPLVGRKAELARVQVALDQAVEGEGGLVLVSGEPGIGKTRLVEELAERANRSGASVVWGRVGEAEEAPPYWPWIQLLQAVLAGPHHDVVSDVLAGSAGVIAAILPEVKEFVADLAPPPVLDPADARFRLHHAVLSFLAGVNRRQRLVVVLEDVHWADVASLDLARFLASRLHDVPVLLVMTYRSVDGGDSEILDDLLGTLARQPRLERIELSGLSVSEVGRFIAETIDVEPAAQTVKAVHARTEGNPFFVAELSRLLKSEGGAGAVSDADGPSLVPIGVRDVVRRRFRRLPKETVDLLLLAAVIGRDFDLTLMASAAGVDAFDALKQIEPAVAAGLVNERADTVGRFWFSHALIRDTLYRELSLSKRVTLHAKVATELERLVVPGSHPAELAGHFFHAAPVVGPERGFEYALAAAQADETVLAYEKAEDDLRRALQLIELMPVEAQRIESELHVQNRLVAVLNMTKGHGAAEVELACTRARELGRQIGENDELFRALNNMAAFRCVHGDLRLAAEYAGQLISIVERRANPIWLSSGHFIVGMAHLHAGRLLAARESFATVREVSAVLELTAEVANYLSGHHAIPMGLTYSARSAWTLGEQSQAYAYAEAALDLAIKLGRPHTLAYAWFGLAHLQVMTGDAAGAQACSETAIGYCDQHDLLAYQGWFRVFRGWAISELGRPAEGVAEMAAAVAFSRSTGARLDVPLFLALLADGELRGGNPARALATIEEALAVSGEVKLWESDLYRRRGELLAAQGPERRDEALESLRLAVSVSKTQGAVPFVQRAVEALAILEPAEEMKVPNPATGDTRLSARECELLALVAQGLTDKEIAAQMVISLATVRSHLDRIRDKTGRRRRPELTRLARDLKLADD